MLDQSNTPPTASPGRAPQDEANPTVEQRPPTPAVHTDHGTPSTGIPQRNDGYASYSAVVTARFPNRESGLRAREQFARMNRPPVTHTLQWFEKGLVENQWGDALPGLAVGEVALIAHVADAQSGEQIVHLCEAAGATRARFYPVQRIFQ